MKSPHDPDPIDDSYRAEQARHFADDAAARDTENEGKERTYARKAAIIAQILAGTRSVLEIGCGSGLFTRAFAEAMPEIEILATDVFPEVIERARRRLSDKRITFEVYDAEADSSAMPLVGHADAVCGVDILHHLEFPSRALSAWRRAVKPGGRLAVLESNPKNPVLFARLVGRPAEKRVMLNSRRNLTRWATEAGWSNVSVTYSPLYLPNGPRALWPTMEAAEHALHALRVLRPVSGLFLVTAVRSS